MTKRAGLWALALTVLGACIAPTVFAQHMYLDTSGDGVNSSMDGLASRGATYVDIWVQTDAGRDGRATALRDEAGNLPSINSYTFILRAKGGVVQWGKFENLQPTMKYPFGERKNATDYYNGFGGLEYLPAGRVKLGRLRVTVESGTPRIEIVSKSALWDGARSSFGSACAGADFDNTLKLAGTGADAEPVGRKGQGDWFDATGVGVQPAAIASDAVRRSAPDLKFGVRVRQNPSAGGTGILLTTTRGGFVKVRLFDLSGRLVGTLLNERYVDPGEHLAAVTSPMVRASGVYFYKVEAPEGTRSGRIIVLNR